MDRLDHQGFYIFYRPGHYDIIYRYTQEYSSKLKSTFVRAPGSTDINESMMKTRASLPQKKQSLHKTTSNNNNLNTPNRYSHDTSQNYSKYDIKYNNTPTFNSQITPTPINTDKNVNKNSNLSSNDNNNNKSKIK
jgi:hypothetical protein